MSADISKNSNNPSYFYSLQTALEDRVHGLHLVSPSAHMMQYLAQ